jgi:hypothetical protein
MRNACEIAVRGPEWNGPKWRLTVLYLYEESNTAGLSRRKQDTDWTNMACDTGQLEAVINRVKNDRGL